MSQILPWQQPIWERLQQQLTQQRVPHALLLHGPVGTGKGRFATVFAQRLLCSTPAQSGHACGACPSCKLFIAETHPDLIRLEPEEGKAVLAVDQVRSMVEEFAYTPQIAARKVVIVQPAESMNVSAANSLLKTLEEPPGEAVMLLVSHAPAKLLPTIRSRCQQIAFPVPARAESLRWLEQEMGQQNRAEEVLQLAENAPLKAVALADPELLEHRQKMGQELIDLLAKRTDPIRVALRWSSKKLDPTITLNWLQQWTAELIKAANHQPPIGEPIQTVAQRLQSTDQRHLFLFYDKVTEAVSLSTTPVNKELLFEGLLLEWSNLR